MLYYPQIWLSGRISFTKMKAGTTKKAESFSKSHILVEKYFGLTPNVYYRLFRNECPFINDLCTNFSGHFLAICMFIFHKTDVVMIILRCLIGLAYDWFKSYDTKRRYFHFFLFCNFVQKQTFAYFVFFAFLCFFSSL